MDKIWIIMEWGFRKLQRNDKGNIFSKKDDIMKKWRQYIQKLSEKEDTQLIVNGKITRQELEMQ